mgnify:CR=1 FL=1
MAAAYVTTAAVYGVTLLSNSDLRQPPIWIPLTGSPVSALVTRPEMVPC